MEHRPQHFFLPCSTEVPPQMPVEWYCKRVPAGGVWASSVGWGFVLCHLHLADEEAEAWSGVFTIFHNKVFSCTFSLFSQTVSWDTSCLFGQHFLSHEVTFPALSKLCFLWLLADYSFSGEEVAASDDLWFPGKGRACKLQAEGPPAGNSPF